MERKTGRIVLPGPPLTVDSDGRASPSGARIWSLFDRQALEDLNIRYAGDLPLLEVISRETARLRNSGAN